LADEILGRDRAPAPRFLPQGGRAFAKPSPPGAQSFFEYDAMLGFGTPPVLGGPALQRFDDILGNVSDQELRHVALQV
jgi:hypothetical protein